MRAKFLIGVNLVCRKDNFSWYAQVIGVIIVFTRVVEVMHDVTAIMWYQCDSYGITFWYFSVSFVATLHITVITSASDSLLKFFLTHWTNDNDGSVSAYLSSWFINFYTRVHGIRGATWMEKLAESFSFLHLITRKKWSFTIITRF